MSSTLNLSFTPLLEVALGLFVMFAVVSTTASAGVELLETWLRRRARHLARGVAELLAAAKAPSDLLPLMVQAFYNSPHISALYRGLVQAGSAADGWVNPGAAGNLPAYIPAQRFANAVLLFAEDKEALQHSLPGMNSTKLDELHAAFSQLVRYVSRGNVEEAKHLEAFFNDSTERISGWFRRDTQRALFVVGLVLAATFNLDAMRWMSELSNNPGTRDAVIKLAEQPDKLLGIERQAVVSACKAPPPAAAAQPGLPVPSDASVQSVPALADADCERARKTLVRAAAQVAVNTELPIGWKGDPLWIQPTSILTAIDWLQKLFGLFITALATCMGAPFWFDLLGRVSQLRAVMKPKDGVPS